MMMFHDATLTEEPQALLHQNPIPRRVGQEANVRGLIQNAESKPELRNPCRVLAGSIRPGIADASPKPGEHPRNALIVKPASRHFSPPDPLWPSRTHTALS